jgi:catechol 2,3-dioxygenase-like lactoylglutathione lyase family enzyme
VENSIAIDHSGFITPSVEQSVRFWTEVMGFEAKPIVERTGEWVSAFTGVPGSTLRIAHLFGHGAHLEFIEFMSPDSRSAILPANQAGLGHVCVKVPDIQRLYERILAAGGTHQGRLTTITEGPAAGVRGLYMRDPTGMVIEVLEARPAG